MTHLDEQEIIDLEKKYWQLKSPSVNGKFDVQLFASITSAPFSSASASDDDLSLDVSTLRLLRIVVDLGKIRSDEIFGSARVRFPSKNLD